MVEGIEILTDAREDVAPVLAAMVAGISDNVELYEEQFFEFQTYTGTLQVFGVLGIVDDAQCLVALHEVEWGGDEVGDGLGLWWQFLNHDSREFLERARCETMFLHLLRGGIVGLQSHVGEFQFVGTVQIWMGDVDAVVEDGGFAEYDIFRTYLISLFRILAPLEPYEVCDARAVAEVSHDAFLSRPHRKCLETEDMTNDLHEGHIARQFVDGIDLGTIYIFIRIVLEQVAIGVDAEFFAQ